MRAQRITGRELEGRFEFSFILVCKSTKKNQADHSLLSNPGTLVEGQFGADSQTDLACEGQKRIRREGSDDRKYVCASQAKTDLNHSLVWSVTQARCIAAHLLRKNTKLKLYHRNENRETNKKM